MALRKSVSSALRLTSAVGLGIVICVTAALGAQPAKPAKWKAPRTADGVADLQGFVRMNAGQLPAGIRKWMGDSIGRWEGDTLVIETTNFHPLQIYRGASENLKVIERLTRAGEGSCRESRAEVTLHASPLKGRGIFFQPSMWRRLVRSAHGGALHS